MDGKSGSGPFVHCTGTGIAEEFVIRFAQKTKLLAENVVDVINMCEEAPRSLTESEKYKKLQEGAQQLIVLGKMKRMVDDGEEVDIRSTAEIEDVAFWAETISAVERVERANMKKYLYAKELEELPSFSIGLTQEKQTQWGSITELCEEIDKEVNDDMLKKRVI
ncbi:unnamed protein product [Cuscuta europaea]|uniref:Uncharacterized protein n=1 Tax=Cuscuta europaea TaxID=41803 RepID=A0A9P0YTS9_CUSEU|nr:unnamed protein product [Cuscuta europaea]